LVAPVGMPAISKWGQYLNCDDEQKKIKLQCSNFHIYFLRVAVLSLIGNYTANVQLGFRINNY
jgi:hypothetical protein